MQAPLPNASEPQGVLSPLSWVEQFKKEGDPFDTPENQSVAHWFNHYWAGPLFQDFEKYVWSTPEVMKCTENLSEENRASFAQSVTSLIVILQDSLSKWSLNGLGGGALLDYEILIGRVVREVFYTQKNDIQSGLLLVLREFANCTIQKEVISYIEFADMKEFGWHYNLYRLAFTLWLSATTPKDYSSTQKPFAFSSYYDIIPEFSEKLRKKIPDFISAEERIRRDWYDTYLLLKAYDRIRVVVYEHYHAHSGEARVQLLNDFSYAFTQSGFDLVGELNREFKHAKSSLYNGYGIGADEAANSILAWLEEQQAPAPAPSPPLPYEAPRNERQGERALISAFFHILNKQHQISPNSMAAYARLVERLTGFSAATLQREIARPRDEATDIESVKNELKILLQDIGNHNLVSKLNNL